MVTSHGVCERSAFMMLSSASASVCGPCRKRQLRPMEAAREKPVMRSKPLLSQTIGWSTPSQSTRVIATSRACTASVRRASRYLHSNQSHERGSLWMKDIESSDARDLPGPARAPLDGTALRGRSSDARSIRMIAQYGLPSDRKGASERTNPLVSRVACLAGSTCCSVTSATMARSSSVAKPGRVSAVASASSCRTDVPGSAAVFSTPRAYAKAAEQSSSGSPPASPAQRQKPSPPRSPSRRRYLSQ
mmetsp:Transcript_51565/g.136704  ORF Transcript_51565/g.136704 Transcript_51565/m.136704 type:complete len:247 (-) Transcript_51565:69-809(-)